MTTTRSVLVKMLLVVSCSLGCGVGSSAVDSSGDGSDKTTPALSSDSTGGSDTVLTNGVAATQLSGAKGSATYFVLTVPPGATNLLFTLGTGTSKTNDADIYVSFGKRPTTKSYDCRSIHVNLTESCPIPAAQGGDYHVLVYGYSSYSGATLTGSFQSGQVLDGGEPPVDGGSPGRDGGVGSTDGGVGVGGGSVDHLFFAVVGDTRPGFIDGTSSYPTAIIEKIYADIEGMSPRPQFAVSTGDYMFASPTGSSGQSQLALYAQARSSYSGPLFAAMGNHECTGFTSGNCGSVTTTNYRAFISTLINPLQQTLPYYEIPFTALDGSWTAKLVVVACNAWTSTQESWLSAALSRPTTYTFLVRHEPKEASTGPCVTQVEQLMTSHPYDISIVGHTHTFSTNGREVVVGTGGAPLSSGSVPFGYATIEQAGAGFRVTQYDYATALPVKSVVIAH